MSGVPVKFYNKKDEMRLIPLAGNEVEEVGETLEMIEAKSAGSWCCSRKLLSGIQYQTT